jgi:ABC-type branched-subunit amino acid transport system ATPase component
MGSIHTTEAITPEPPLLEVRDLMVFFENALAVNGLSMEVNAGEIVG